MKLKYLEVKISISQRVLVTGAAGFIGLYISEELARDSRNQVFVVDNFARGEDDPRFRALTALTNVTFVEGNILDIVDSLPEFDYIFHLASINGTSNFYERPFEVISAAIEPTFALLHKYGTSPRLKRFVLASTSEVYAGAVENGVSGVPTPESTSLAIENPMNPRWSYAGGKIAAEIATLSAYEQYKTQVTIVRFHNVYGPRMGRDHVIPQLISRFRLGDFKLFGGENTRSFIYISDAVAATIKAGFANSSLGKIVHIGTEDEVSIVELASIIMETVGKHGDLEILAAPDGSVSRRCPDTGFLTKEIGFIPKISLKEGVERTVEHYDQ